MLLQVQNLFSTLVNNKRDVHFFFVYIYSNSLHVSSIPVFIIRRINCINTTSGICQLCRWPSSVQVWMELSSIQTCTLDGHLHTVTYTRCRINTIDSPDDEHRGARNWVPSKPAHLTVTYIADIYQMSY